MKKIYLLLLTAISLLTIGNNVATDITGPFLSVLPSLFPAGTILLFALVIIVAVRKTNNYQLPNMPKYLVLSLVFVLASLLSSAQTTYTWNQAGGGSWATAANWTPSRTTPAANDILAINNGGAKTITNVPNQTIGSLTISGTTNVTLTATGGNTLTIGNVTGNDFVIASGSQLTMSTNVSITLNTSATADISGIFSIATGRTYNTNGTTVVTAVTGTINNSGIITNATSAKLLFQANSIYNHNQDGGTIPTASWNSISNCNITGMTITYPGGTAGQAFGNFTFNSSFSSGNIEMASDLSCNNFNMADGGTSALRLTNSNANNTMTVTGDFNMTSGNFTLVSGNGNGIINVIGNFSISGGKLIMKEDNGLSSLNVGGNFSMSGASTVFEFRPAATPSTATVTVTGNFSLSAGTMDMTGVNAVGTLNVGGDFTDAGGTITETSTGSGAIIFNKAGVQTYTSGGTISNTINFTVNSGSTLQMAAPATAVQGGGTFTLSNGATLGIMSAAGITATGGGAVGNIQVTGTRTFNTGSNYTYNGTAAQASGSGLPATVNNLSVANGDLITGLTIAANVLVNGALNLTSGLLTTGANTVTVAAAATINGGSATSYVNGKLARLFNATGSKIFPVGKGGNYRPVSFAYASLTGTSTITIEQFESALTGTLPGSTNLFSARYWDITQNGGTGLNYKVTLDPTGYTPLGPVKILKKESGTITANASTTPNYTNSTGFTTFNGTNNGTNSFALGDNCTATTANAGPDQSGAGTCSLTVTLAANVASVGTGSWSIVSGAGGSFGNASSPTSTFTGVAGTSYTLRWTIANNPCSASTDDVIITFAQYPTTADAGPDQTGISTCGSTTTSLAANTVTTGSGSWTIVTGAGGSFGNSSSPTSTFSGTAGITYTLRWTISTVCGISTDDVVIIFNQNPTTANAGPDQTGAATCGLTTITLAANNPSVGTGSWSIVLGAGGSFGNINSPVSTFSGTAGTAYTLEWTTATLCSTSSDDVNVYFNVPPSTADAGPDQTGSATCGLTTVTLASNTPVLGTGIWAIVSGIGGTINDPSSETSTFDGLAGNTYVLSWTITNGSCTSSDSVTILFNEGASTADAGPDQNGSATCGLTTVSLAANTPSFGNGTWSIVSGIGGSFGNANSPTSTFSGITGNTYTLKWTIASACDFSDDNVDITFSQLPAVDAGPDQTGAATCELTTVTLAANTPSTGAGTWTIIIGAGGSFGNTNDPASTFSGVAGTSYTLRWTINDATCSASDDVVIKFNQNPTIADAGPDQTGAATCGLTTVTLAGNVPSIGTGVWSIISGAGGSFANVNNPTSTFSGVAGTTYTLRWRISNNPCTSSSDDVVVSFNRNPTVANAGPDQSGAATCGLTVTLAANIAVIGTGSWSIISGAGGSFGNTDSPTSTFTGVAGTSYTLRWTITNSPCTASTDDVIIVFSQSPTVANAGPDQTDALTCGLTIVTLAGNIPSVGTGAWTIISGAGGSFGNAGSATSTFNGVAGTTYTLRWTISNSPCTASTDDVVITFNKNPTTANAGPDQIGSATCGSTSVTLAANSPSVGTGAWSVVTGAGGSFGNVNSATSTFSGVAGTAYTLRWTITNNPCTASTDDVNITFNQNPTVANAGPDQTGVTTCGLTTITLAGNTPIAGTGAWTIIAGAGGSFGNAGSPTSTFSGVVGTSYTLRWTISNSPCTASTDDVIIKFNLAPTTANAGPDQTGSATCNLTTVTLAGNLPIVGTGNWTIVAGIGGSIATPTVRNSTFSGVAGNTYTLRWTITNSPCTSTDDVDISFNRNPTVANAGPDQTTSATCGLTIVTLAANSPAIGTGSWSVVTGAGGSFSNINSPTSTFSGVAGTAYTLRWTISSNPCTASTDDVNITFNQNPATANAGLDQTGASTCGVTTVTLSANTPSAGTGSWSIITGAGGSFGNAGSATSTFSGTAGTTYTLRWTISSSPCAASTDDVSIKFNQNPTTANAGPDQTGAATCGSTSVTLAGNAPSIGTGTWTIVSGVGGTITTPTNKNSPFSGVTGNTYTLRWTITNSPCTASFDDVDITFNRTPTTANAGPDQVAATTCGITTVNLAANNPAFGTGSWSIISGAGGSLGNPSSPTSSFSGVYGVTYTLRWTISNPPCGTSTDDVLVQFNDLPTVTISADYCSIPGKVRLTANPLPAGTYTYAWTTGAATSFIDIDIAGTYSVAVTNSNGCIGAAATSISTELAVNGNFNAGNTGFVTGYTFTNSQPNGLVSEGLYAIGTDAHLFHPNFWGKDHSSTTGNFMIVNGSPPPAGKIVWKEGPVAVIPNTTYYFSAWALSLNAVSPFAQLQFNVDIGGGPISIGTTAVLAAGVEGNTNNNNNWVRFYGVWSSGASTSATLSIVDLQTALGGNDFGLDDISISTLSPAPFSVAPSILGGGTSVCVGNTLNLSANLIGGTSPFIFAWTGPNGFTSSLQNPSIPNASAANSGVYSVTVTDAHSCSKTSNRTISVVALPAAPSPATATPSTICLGSSTNLNASTPVGTQGDFAGIYGTGNWTISNNPAGTGGNVDVVSAPYSVYMVSGNNGFAGTTDYTRGVIASSGTITFDWSYSTTDAAGNDYPQYLINGVATTFPAYNMVGPAIQSGSASIPVTAGQTFAFRMVTTTGTLGAGSIIISNFSGPSTGNISWYTVPTGGVSIGNTASGANLSVTPASTGVISYYAEAVTSIGCVGSSRAQVNVTVNAPPAFTLCPSNISTTAAAGVCTQVVNYSATASGSITPTITYVFTGATTGSGSGTGSGSTFNKGVTTVTITASTGCGSNATCTFTITITDNQAPTITCPSNINQNADAGVCSASVVVPNPVTFDNCGVTVLSYTLTGATTFSSPVTGINTVGTRTFNVGITTITYTVKDAAGNSTTCNFTVTVADNQAPVINCHPGGPFTRNANHGFCTYTAIGNEFNPTASDNCTAVTISWSITGATTISGTSPDLIGVVLNKGINNVLWIATDASGNTATCNQTITVRDAEAPVFTCLSNAVRTANTGVCTYTSVGTEFNPTATDNCSVASKTAVLTGATTGAGFVTLAGVVFNSGITTVTWSASDGTNTATCSFTVTVNDNQAPVFTCISNATRNTNTGVCSYTAVGAEFNPTATDNCAVISKTAVLTGATTGSGLTTLNGVALNKGVTTVTWTASDGINTATCSFTVTVNDNEFPTITCPADVISCSSTPALGNPTVSDNCPGVTASNNAPANFPVGTTIVTWTATDASGHSTTCTQSVTVNPATPATPGAISGSTPVCETTAGLVYSISTVTNATTYTWTVPTGWTITSGVGTTSITVTAGAAGQSGNITVTAGNSCGTSAQSSLAVTITATGTWLGITASWDNPVNWCGGVPTNATNVFIPVTGSGLYPVVSSQKASAHNLSISSGASLIVNGYTLEIAGVITNNGGVFDASNGVIELSGTAGAQTISGSAFTGRNISTLINDNPSGINVSATAGDTLRILSWLTFGTVSNSVINTNNNLTLVSTDTATASVGKVLSGNSITGNVTVERYISAGRKWRFLAIPTNTTQTFRQSWQENSLTAGDNLHPSFGMQITDVSANWNAKGFDALSPGGPSVKTFDPATNNYNGINSTGDAIKTTGGYMSYVRGDRSATTANTVLSSTVLRTTGPLYTGDQPAIPVPTNQFVPIGNPYASVIDMRNINKTGVQDFFYVWDPKLGTGSSYGLGAFQTFFKAGSDYEVVPGGGSYGPFGTTQNFIESGLAFFVRGAEGGNMTFEETDKTDARSSQVFRLNDDQPQLVMAGLQAVTATGNILMDGSIAIFGDGYADGVDNDDALKMKNTSENVSMRRYSKLLAVERRPKIVATDTLYLNLTGVKVQNYRWEVDLQNMDINGLSAFLVDNYLSTSTPLNVSGITPVDFSIANIPGSYAADRFMIVFNRVIIPLPVTIASVSANRLNDGTISVNWKVENETSMEHYDVERSADGRTFNKIGTTDPTANNGGSASYNHIDNDPLSSDNFYRIKALSRSGQVQYSAIVKVAPLKIASAIKVYPNPVVGKTINVQFSNQPAGNYDLQLTNKLGQSVYNTTIQINNNNTVKSLFLGAAVAAGNYQLTITTADGAKIIEQLMIE